MRIIPAIDIIDGKLVRLTQGDYSRSKSYSDNPVEIAKGFVDSGIEYLHLVDLDGARAGEVVNIEVLENICSQTTLKVDFGGGVKTSEQLKRVLDAGAVQVTGGSIAVKNPDEFQSWLDTYGSEKIILGCDAKDGKIAVSGWQESSEITIEGLINSFQGVSNVICTDISQDGTLEGPNLELYTQLVASFPKLNVIASGGVGSQDDLLALKETGVEGVILGKAIYEGKVDLSKLSEIGLC